MATINNCVLPDQNKYQGLDITQTSKDINLAFQGNFYCHHLTLRKQDLGPQLG